MSFRDQPMSPATQLTQRLENELSEEGNGQPFKLPSERDLAILYGVARGTVREALRRLSARGLVELHQGRRALWLGHHTPASIEQLPAILGRTKPVHPAGRLLLLGYLELKRDLLIRATAGCCARQDDESMTDRRVVAIDLLDHLRMSSIPAVLMGAEMDLLMLLAQGSGSIGDQLLARTIASAGRDFAELFTAARNRVLALRWQRELVISVLVGPPEDVGPRLLAHVQADDAALVQELTAAAATADAPDQGKELRVGELLRAS